MILIFLLLLSCFNAALFHALGENPSFYQLQTDTWESEPFRELNMGNALCEMEEINYDQIASLMTAHDFDLTNCHDLSYHKKMIELQKPEAYRKLKGAYRIIFEDLKYFPVPESTKTETPPVCYENSWNERRTYGGKRSHEGCDIMGNQCQRGFYPVISISDGVVEKIGWLEQGGWRIGIRTPSGLYLYYAHLYSYSRNFRISDSIRAGELLGYMGDSGYGKQENTVGNFDVHLHIGVYLKTDRYEEMSVNPYWILKYLEKRKRKYRY